jgi:CelD/BcsL family acetyltransferase involved in cellulose biosynthesis
MAATASHRAAPTVEVHTDPEDFDRLRDEWTELEERAAEDNVFLTWIWQHAWWTELGGDHPLRLLAFRLDGRLVGIAPTYLDGPLVRFGGGLEVTDYLGFIVEAGMEEEVGCAFLRHWRESPELQLDFHFLRPDGITLRTLKTAANSLGIACTEEDEEVSPRILLQGGWDDYLQGLEKDKRHELRRKRRRLEEAGGWTLRETGPGELDRDLTTFFDLHRRSSRAKDDFLVGPVQSFFRHISHHLQERGWLALRLMEMAGRPVAAVLGFVYRGKLLLYNSGYDPHFHPLPAADGGGAAARLSTGFVLMSEQVRLSIEQGLSEVDFLRGNERYKYDLGAHDVVLRHLRLDPAGGGA